MPPALVKSFAKKSGKSASDVEALWNKAKASAAKKSPPPEDEYAYIVGTLKKMLKIEGLEIDPTDLLIELVLLGEDATTLVESIAKNGFLEEV